MLTYEQIEKELEEFGGDVYYINILPQFVWSETEKKVKGYHEQSTHDNKLIVLNTELIELGQKTLKEYLDEKEVTDEDVLVFCINPEFIPRQRGNWVRVHIVKKQFRKKQNLRRDDI